jgi:hypothetical protein
MINHTLREGNARADCFTKIEASSNSALVILDLPPIDLYLSLLAHAQVVAFVSD